MNIPKKDTHPDSVTYQSAPCFLHIFLPVFYIFFRYSFKYFFHTFPETPYGSHHSHPVPGEMPEQAGFYTSQPQSCPLLSQEPAHLFPYPLLIATALKPILTDYINSPGGGPLKSFVNVLGPNLISMFIAFGLLYWVTMSRIIRGQVLQLKQQEYVTAARALGASGGRIIRRHLLPNCIGQIVVTTCLQIPSAIFLESFLSYLGVGVSAPLPSLGSMATDALSGMYTYTYRLIVPSVILSVMILAFNLFGDGLRDALDPKLKK